MDVGMLLFSLIPTIIFIGAAAVLEIVFDFIYDRSESFREWADNYLYKE